MTCPFFVPRNDTLTLKWICINFTFSCCVYVCAQWPSGKQDTQVPKDLSDLHVNAETISRSMCSMQWLLWGWLAFTHLHMQVISDLLWTAAPRRAVVNTQHFTNLPHFMGECDVKMWRCFSDLGCKVTITLWSSLRKVKDKSPTLTLAFLTRQKRFSLVNLKRCAVIKMRVMIKERLGSAASRGVGGADKNRLHYAVHLVNKWNNGEACSGNAGRMAQNPIESFWPLAA